MVWLLIYILFWTTSTLHIRVTQNTRSIQRLLRTKILSTYLYLTFLSLSVLLLLL
ncbi:hypothetical protein BY458DRAFT_495944 [Sporodiniella umbellata]|nr:hypothetical protein BY458DRAFT_495944 [Sporodiniella umbellata]